MKKTSTGEALLIQVVAFVLLVSSTTLFGLYGAGPTPEPGPAVAVTQVAVLDAPSCGSDAPVAPRPADVFRGVGRCSE